MCDSVSNQTHRLFSTKICTEDLNIHRTICLEMLTVFQRQSQNLVKLHNFLNFNCCTQTKTRKWQPFEELYCTYNKQSKIILLLTKLRPINISFFLQNDRNKSVRSQQEVFK